MIFFIYITKNDNIFVSEEELIDVMLRFLNVMPKNYINMDNSYGILPVFHISNNFNLLKIVLNEPENEYPVEFLCKNTIGLSPLSVALYEKKFEVVQMIIEYCNKHYLVEKREQIFNSTDHFGNSPIHLACKTGEYIITKLLIDTKLIKSNVKNIEGKTPLLLAIENDHFQIFQYLIENDPTLDINMPDNFGSTPIMATIKKNKLDYAFVLLKQKNIDLNIKNSLNQNFLLLVINKKYSAPTISSPILSDCYINEFMSTFPACYDSLLQKPSSMATDICITYKTDPYIIIIANTLLHNSVDINGTDKFGLSPLLIACKHLDMAVFNMLVRYKDFKNDFDKCFNYLNKEASTYLSMLKNTDGDEDDDFVTMKSDDLYDKVDDIMSGGITTNGMYSNNAPINFSIDAIPSLDIRGNVPEINNLDKFNSLNSQKFITSKFSSRLPQKISSNKTDHESSLENYEKITYFINILKNKLN